MKISKDIEYLIVGCGLSGAVIAEQIASVLNKKVLIIDKRNHIGGNCYDYKDLESGINIHKYGPHFFHTNNEKVWKYVNQFSEWVRWEHKVLAYVDDSFVNLPPNINTINNICKEHIQTTDECQSWLDENVIKYEKEPSNSEEVAKSRVGEVLYDKLFRDYTYKQWKKNASELNKSVLERIPVRTNFDDRYFSDKYQALPKDGYAKFIEKIISHKNISYQLGVNFFEINQKDLENVKIIFTGPIDAYYASKGFPKLEYRSLEFKQETILDTNFFQPTSQVNYPSLKYDFTRIIEYKHLLNQNSKHSVIVKEYPKDDGEPYYPVPNDRNLSLYEKYKELAEKDSEKILFVGRLASYKYFNMDEAINNALIFFNNKILK